MKNYEAKTAFFLTDRKIHTYLDHYCDRVPDLNFYSLSQMAGLDKLIDFHAALGSVSCKQQESGSWESTGKHFLPDGKTDQAWFPNQKSEMIAKKRAIFWILCKLNLIIEEEKAL